MLVFIKCTSILGIYFLHAWNAEAVKYIEILENSSSVSRYIRLLYVLLWESLESVRGVDVRRLEGRGIELLLLLLISSHHFLDVIRITSLVVGTILL